MHDIISVGLPMIAILAGILFNRSDTRDLRNEVRSEMGSLRNEMSSLRNEMRGEIKRLGDKIDENRDAAHRDTLEILRSMTSLHERVAIVEDRQNR